MFELRCTYGVNQKVNDFGEANISCTILLQNADPERSSHFYRHYSISLG